MNEDLLQLLLPAPTPADWSWTWGTVTQASPLRVRVDGDSTALDLTPDTLVADLQVGQRVRLHRDGRRAVVIGAAGGDPAPAWAPYTPTLSGITVGNASASGRYTRIGDTVIVEAQMIVGSTTSMNGFFYFSLPVNSGVVPKPGSAVLTDSGSNIYTAWAFALGTAFYVSPLVASGGHSGFGPSLPFPWAAGDSINATVTYEAA